MSAAVYCEGRSRLESMVEDLKPDDLCLTRLKPVERWVEDRTVVIASLGRAGYRGESPPSWAIAGSAETTRR